MNYRNRFKKNGFSLMEILIAVFIVAILSVVTIPVINKQLSKTNEYSYYLAYNTVVKMAGQIVALGDPEDDTAFVTPDTTRVAHKFDSLKLSATNWFNNLAAKYTNTHTFILSKFVPKTFAAQVTTPAFRSWGGWTSDAYDEDLWMGYQVCQKGRTGQFIKDVKTETVVNEVTGESTTNTTYDYYVASDFNNCIGYDESGSITDEYGFTLNTPKNQVIRDVLNDEYSELITLTAAQVQNMANAIANQNYTGTTPNARAFCEGIFRNLYSGTKKVGGVVHTVSVNFEPYDSGEDEGDDEDEEESGTSTLSTDYYSEEGGVCEVTSEFMHTSYNEDENQHVVSREVFKADWCDKNGFYNMRNYGADEDPTTIDCQCKQPPYTSVDYVLSTNSEKACVRKCDNPGELPYVTMTKNAAGKITYTGSTCCANDFNAKTNKCCPAKSLYNPTAEKCECVSGYEMNAAQTECKLVDCPAGSHKTSDGICVINPPITSGKRFCEEIGKHWNLSGNPSCNTFSTVDGFNVNSDVYNAALGKNNTTYLSVDSKIGAFKNITPNVEFSNGLKMWILGDKAASIPGLSYFAPTMKPTQNMCVKKVMSNHTAIECYNAGGYFCKSENTCIMLDNDSKAAIRDARNCCAAPDMSDLQAAAEAAGQDWLKDPSAYAISGFTVFVDINADKGEGTLWEDVFPFFVTAEGAVYPAYPLDGNKAVGAEHTALYNGGNSDKLLPVDVYFYKSSSNSRLRQVAFSSVSYARAICSARKMSMNTPYCMNLGGNFKGGDGLSSANCPTEGGCTSLTKLNGTTYLNITGKESRNPCDHYNCFVSVRRKLRSF